MKILFLFLLKELQDIKTNKQVWPVYLLLPPVILGVSLSVATILPGTVKTGAAKGDAVMQSLMQIVLSSEEFAAMSEDEAMTRYFLRSLVVFFLLMPLGISSISAAYSIVGEKQQRTLEPVLAAPITDRQFMLSKMLASGAPAIVVTLATASLATIMIAIITFEKYGMAVLPDRFWVMSVLVLAPLLAFGSVLATMRVSARMTDPQAANQFASLVIMPVFIACLAVFWKLLTLNFIALCVAGILVSLLDFYLFHLNLRKFQREEILTKWR
jgi:ABC-2 type transport system permease protein